MQDIKMDLQEKPKNAAAAHQIRLCSRSNHAGVKGKLALPLHQIMRARHQHPDEPNTDDIPEERQRNRNRRKVNRVIYAEILRIEFYTELIICRGSRKLLYAVHHIKRNAEREFIRNRQVTEHVHIQFEIRRTIKKIL